MPTLTGDAGVQRSSGAAEVRRNATEGSVMLARLDHARQERDRGFTLIEVLVVIIIIGILAGIAIPVFLNQRKKGYDAQTKSDLINMAIAEETYLTDNPGSYSSSVPTLLTLGFKESANTSSPSASAHSSASYCLSETSQSGTVWYLDSSNSNGPTTTVCS
jgi:type IV pilus assembly protein PilA